MPAREDDMVMNSGRGHPRSEVAHPADTAAEAGLPLPVAFPLVLAALVVVAAGYGLLVDDAYRSVPALVRETWRAQDAVTLAAVPVLLWAGWRARSGSFRAHVVWVGVLFWLTYAYAHLALGTPYNDVFLVYVAVLGLAGFGTLDGLLRVDVAKVSPAFVRAPRQVVAWFLLVAGLGIAVLWLSEIVAALPDELPTNIHLAELPNPTWVLDLAWLIPVSVAAALLLWRRHPAAPLLAGVVLVMLLILSLAMLLTTPFAIAAGLQADPDVRPQLVVFTVLFFVLGAIEAWLLTVASRGAGDITQHWRRRSWWN